MGRTRIIALRLAPLLLVCAVFALPSGTAAASPCSYAQLIPSSTNGAQVRAATLCLINHERTRRGLAPLKSNRHLLKAAGRYSGLMVNERFFGHVSPGGSTLVNRVRKGTTYLRGARRWALGENLAWGSGKLATPSYTVKAWMNSPGHRRNMLTPGFRHIGIGVVTGAPVATKVLAAATYTTDFGRRS
ncbi:MAG: CAP domain-containing protein [Actinomycetota bacterium]|nr:CAP domain-containing protein [Actinomycetota bacterium]